MLLRTYSPNPFTMYSLCQSEENGWCVGVLSGRQGLFPDNFVQFSRGEDVTIASQYKW